MTFVRARVGVLVSGGGSNLQALIDACTDADFPAEIAVVVSNVPTAFALERARRAGIRTEIVPHQSYPHRPDFDAALVTALTSHAVEIVCLAGFMRIVGTPLLEAFPHRVLNIHPALLPAFPGLHAPRQALAYGVKISGCTVHLVDEGMDTGPVLVQAAVPVEEGDTEETLATRILEQEHLAYPRALALVASGRMTVDGRRTRVV